MGIFYSRAHKNTDMGRPNPKESYAKQFLIKLPNPQYSSIIWVTVKKPLEQDPIYRYLWSRAYSLTGIVSA